MNHSHQHARLTWLRNIYTSERTSVLWTHSRSRAISTRGSRGCATYTQAKEPLCCGRTHKAEPSARAAHVVVQHIHKRKNLCAVDALTKQSHQHARLTCCARYTQAKEPLCCGRTHEAEPSARAAHVLAQDIHKRKNLCAVDALTKQSHQHARLTWLRKIYTSERTSVLWTHSAAFNQHAT